MASARGSRRYKRIVADLREKSRATNARCARCGQEIDYDAPTWDPSAFQAGHIRSWSEFPELREDPSNFQPEHALCNQEAGDGDEPPGLGMTSEDW